VHCHRNSKADVETRTMRVNQPAVLMRAIWRKHGFPSARPHDLRRTGATLIQSAVLRDRLMKWSVEEVGWLLGHRNEKGGPVTLFYARVRSLRRETRHSGDAGTGASPHPGSRCAEGGSGLINCPLWLVAQPGQRIAVRVLQFL
jgi:hypothetical protein